MEEYKRCTEDREIPCTESRAAAACAVLLASSLPVGIFLT